MLFTIGVLNSKFHGKTSVLESLFNKITGHQAGNLIKERLQHWCFFLKLVKFVRTPFL